ncbi:hypothetical protein ACWEV4_29780 [Streptomyces sp. NPDC003860]
MTTGDNSPPRRQETPKPRTEEDSTDSGSRGFDRHRHGDTDDRQRHGDGTDTDTATPTTDSDTATGPTPTTVTRRQRHGDGTDSSDSDSDTATGPTAATPTPLQRHGDTDDRHPSSDTTATTGATAAELAAFAGESMKSASFSLPPSLIERVRAAQWHTQLQPDGHHNVSELVRTVLLGEVLRLEDRHNGGRPFPRVERLRSGPSPQGAMRGAQLRASRRRQEEPPAQPFDAGDEGQGQVHGGPCDEGAERTNPASEGGAAR